MALKEVVTTLRPRIAVILASLPLVLVLGIAGGKTLPASAATVGCGARCEGKDPASFVVASVGPAPGKPIKCGDDAITPRSTSGKVFETTAVELRYSPYCRTAWARAKSPGYLGFVTVESFGSGSNPRKTYKSGGWTDMVNDKGMSARACHWQWDNDYDHSHKPPYKTGCTGKF